MSRKGSRKQAISLFETVLAVAVVVTGASSRFDKTDVVIVGFGAALTVPYNADRLGARELKGGEVVRAVRVRMGRLDNLRASCWDMTASTRRDET